MILRQIKWKEKFFSYFSLLPQKLQDNKMDYLLICFVTSILRLDSKVFSRKTHFILMVGPQRVHSASKRLRRTPSYSCQILGISTQYSAMLLASLSLYRTMHLHKQCFLSWVRFKQTGTWHILWFGQGHPISFCLHSQLPLFLASFSLPCSPPGWLLFSWFLRSRCCPILLASSGDYGSLSMLSDSRHPFWGAAELVPCQVTLLPLVFKS